MYIAYVSATYSVKRINDNIVFEVKIHNVQLSKLKKSCECTSSRPLGRFFPFLCSHLACTNLRDGYLSKMASSITSIPSASTEGFQNASSYDMHRPTYPREAVTRLLKHLQIHGVKKARIVDLAAGTGKFTELLVARDEDFEILAIEPHDGG